MIPENHLPRAVLDGLPDKQMFDYQNMNKQRQRDFDQWYEANKNHKFHVFQELVSYCENDVILLSKCYQAFKDMYMNQVCEVNPFFSSLTLANLCFTTFLRSFYEPDETGNYPLIVMGDDDENLDRKRQHSILSAKYLGYLCSLGEQIKHGANSKHELTVGWPVDGIDLEKKVVYQVSAVW